MGASDSTFILRQRYIGKDSLAFGTIGQWHVVNGLMTVGSGTDRPEFWRYTAKGIENVDEMGRSFESMASETLEKLADELQDQCRTAAHGQLHLHGRRHQLSTRPAPLFHLAQCRWHWTGVLRRRSGEQHQQRPVATQLRQSGEGRWQALGRRGGMRTRAWAQRWKVTVVMSTSSSTASIKEGAACP